MAKPEPAGTQPPQPGTDLIQIFTICEKINQMLLAGMDEAAWRALPPSGKGRTIAELFAHIHNVRLMWLEAAAKESTRPSKLDKLGCTPEESEIRPR